ncbi:hypothetical protein ACNTMW_29280 [Planosporangium sp. 12N6]|uniref:hypothetical protein n=1 Tax=Planosporangium spinosum TaxID=3402278 RepID=UPI003CE76CAE
MASYRPVTALPRHVLERSDMRQAIARHDFGTVFTLARKWAGISYSKIAETCAIKPERVGALARGEGSVTSYQKIAQIADALRIPGHMLGLAPRAWETAIEPTSRHLTAVRPCVPFQEIGDETVRRRDFLRTSAVSAGITLGLPAVTAATGQRIGADVPILLRERAARLRRLDNIVGGGDTYRLYLGEYETTKALLRESTYTEATGRQLLSVLAEQAQQAGWAAFDAGNHPRATWLYRASYAAASQASDAPLAGNALAFLAYQRIGTDRSDAVKTATESCRTAGADVPVTVRALLHERLAWAHAVAGNATDAEHALAAAEAALTDGTGDPQPD